MGNLIGRDGIMKKIFLLLILFLFPGVVSGVEITSKEQLNQPGITIGISQGSVTEEIVKRELPEASLAYFTDGGATGYNAVAIGKIDAYVADLRQMEMSIESGLQGVHLLDETMDEKLQTAIGISEVSQIPDLKGKINKFISELRENGTLDEMYQRWVVDGNEQMPEIELDDDPEYHLVVGTAGIVPPYAYYKGSELYGHDIELAYRFAAWLDADLEFKVIDFTGLIPAAMSGKIDCIFSDLQVSKERQENFTFSDAVMEEQLGIMVRGDAPQVPKVSADYKPYDGKRIGVVTGSTGGPAVEANLPNAKISYFDSVPDMLTALQAQKVDAIAATQSILNFVRMEGENITLTDDFLLPVEIAALFPKNEKGQKLNAQYSEFVRKLWDDGTIDEIDSIWFGEDESKKTILDYENLPETNGTLTMAVDIGIAPFVYLKDGKIVGYDVDIAARFCKAYGYRLVIQNMSFSAIMPSVVSGKSDFSACDMAITPERAESVLFSEPTYYDGLVLAVRGEDAAEPESDDNSGISDQILALDGKRIGVQTGQTFDKLVLDVLPEAEIVYVNSKADLINSLLAGKIDSYAVDEPVIKTQMRENNKISYIPEYLSAFEFGYVFPKTDEGETLRNQFSEFIRKIRTDGTMKEIESKWMNPDQSQWVIPDYASFPAPNGKLTMATEALYAPFTFIFNNEIVGYDIDIAARFCEAYGYGLEITDMDFSGIIPSVQGGKCDFGGAGITITAERAESVHFSEPNYSGGVVLAVRAEDLTNSGEPAFEKVPKGIYDSLSDLSEKRIGVQTGSGFDTTLLNVIPDAKIVYLNNKADLVNSLLAFKIDGFVVDEPVAEIIVGENSRLTYIPDYVDVFDFGYVFPKNDDGEDLCDDFSEFLEEIKSDGTLEKIEKRWFSDDESEKSIPDYKSLPAPNGTLRLAVEALYEPFCYILNNQIVGYDIDIAVRFCEAYGYGLEIHDMSFDAVLSAVQTGKADFGGSGINITPERAESVLFSEPNYSGGTVVVVLREEETGKYKLPEFSTFSDLNGKTISMINGAPFEEQVRNKGMEPGQFTYYANMPDVILALMSGKTDAFITNSAVARLLSNRNDELTQFPDHLEETMFGFAFAKGSTQIDIWKSAYDKIPEKTKQDLWIKWTGSDDNKKDLPKQDWPGTNGTVTVAVCDTLEPMSYKGKDGELIGFDEEMILLMAKELDVHVKFTGMEFSVILSTVQSGKALFGAGSIMITKERAESVDFLPYYPASFVMLVRAADFAKDINTPTVSKLDTIKSGFFESWESIKSSFEKTFIREDRWKLIVEGIRNTLVITVLSIIFGTALGFLLFMLWRNNYRFVNFLMSKCMWLVQGTPMVVLLMILFYVIFGSVAIDGIVVAVIGFSLTFGSSVFGLLQIGVGSIDNGQYEAAYALGYSNIRTFFRIILPQAIPHVMNAYKGEIVGLLKATAIVGYIAVQDLTKMGDIIRSRTYEAFFPLIAVTVIYFLLEIFLGLLVRSITVHIDPKRRKRKNILKGVKTND